MDEKNILIIDDDKDLVAAWRLILESEGYAVRHAINSKLGLEEVKKARPDLIILDVMMDRETEGFHTAYILRSTDPKSEYYSYREIPLIMLTSIHDHTHFNFDDGVQTEWLPVDEFVEKPVQPQELLSIIKGMIKE